MKKINEGTAVIFSVAVSIAYIVFAITFFTFDNSSSNAEAASWYNSDWQCRKPITIDSTKVTADLVNFPVLISITDSDLQADAQLDGGDILFTLSNGTTKLSHEIEKYESTTGELVAWVKIPTLSSSVDTDIYIYYGNISVADQWDINNVWDSNFKMVQHFQESPTNDVAGHFDSTSSANNGTPKNFDSLPTSTTDGTGQINGADVFDGSNDYVLIPDSASLSFDAGSSFTFSAWVKTSVCQASGSKFVEKKLGSDNIQIQCYPPDNKTKFSVRDSNGISASATGTTLINDSQWHHLVGVKNGNNLYIYVDGFLEGSVSPSFTGNWDDGDIRIGTSIDGGLRYVNGLIDEVRISNIAKSADWIKTSYNNQKSPSTFYSIGVEENYSLPIPPNVFGWAWSENIGWISFNSARCDVDDNGFIDIACGGDNITKLITNYGVNLNSATNNLSGYAWSENIGWISFEPADIAGCPSGTCQPCYDLGTNEFLGWARALNYGDGWDGWISLNCEDNGSCAVSDYKVSLNSNDFEGWAWGGDVMGWISFNCINEGCPGPIYKVYLANNSPTALIVCDPASCEAYTYNGTNLGAYGLNLINNSTDSEDCTNYPTPPCAGPPGFASCLWDIDTGGSTIAVCSDRNLNLPPGTHTADLIVTDQGGLSASAPQKTLTFKQDIFADFECSVDGGSVWVDCTIINPEAEDIINFRAVDGDNLSITGSGVALVSFDWEFGDGVGADFVDPTSYTYAAGPADNVYTVTLIITDSAGRQAKREYDLNVGASLPEWEEVRP